MLIDTHCHLNDAEAFADPEAEIGFAESLGVGRLIVVGTNPPDWDRAIALAERFEQIDAIVGWHPNYTSDYDPSTLGKLRQLLVHPKVKALGEIGLDYHWDYAPREIQFQALRDQLDLGAELELPLVFHARKAYADLLDVLESRPPARYLFHCFAGNEDEARRGVALGAYFGVDGPVTYKNADELRAVLSTIPRDLIVIETDAPYMTPVPYRGKPNRPGYVRYVNDALAALWGVTVSEAETITTKNAAKFFGLELD